MIVRVYYAPYCPHCRDLMRILQDLVESVKPRGVFSDPSWFYDGDTESKVYSGITIVPVQVSKDFESTANVTPTARLKSGWLEKFASTELQKELAEKGKIVDLVSGGGSYPVVEIEFYERGKTKQVVVCGSIRKEDSEKYARNLTSLILALYEVERKSLVEELKIPYQYEVRR